MIRKNGNSRKPAGKSAKRAMAVNLALLMLLAFGADTVTVGRGIGKKTENHGT